MNPGNAVAGVTREHSRHLFGYRAAWPCQHDTPLLQPGSPPPSFQCTHRSPVAVRCRALRCSFHALMSLRGSLSSGAQPEVC